MTSRPRQVKDPTRFSNHHRLQAPAQHSAGLLHQVKVRLSVNRPD